MVLCCVSLPAHDKHTHTVIFLHGRGASARSFSEELLEEPDRRGATLQHIFPSVKWVFPDADLRYCERFREDAQQWFDIWSHDDPDMRRDMQLEGLQENVPKIIRLIQSEALKVGGLRNVVLAGISQGSSIAIHALLNYPKTEDENADARLGAFVGVSSWMSLAADTIQDSRQLLSLGAATPSDAVVRNTPVFLSHSTDDHVVPLAQGLRFRDMLKSYGIDITWKQYERGGHWIYAPAGIEDIVVFLKSQGLQCS
ncbi:phospholipase/carboxylesterase family protein [Xylariaceae sp. FL0016]|nr:phospholipase/carboxylesterase family protein [Xylariaceae sp. FL0016]